MVLQDNEIEERLNSPKNLSTKLLEVRKLKEGGRKLGNTEVPPAVRSLIGSLAVQGEDSQKDIAEAFGVSQPTVGMSARGLIGNRVDASLKADIQEVEERVEKKEKASMDAAHQAALDVMLGSLGVLGSKLQNEAELMKPKDLSRIATDMSRIVSVATGQDKNSVVNNTKVVVYAPQQRKESSYETIDI